MWWRILLIVLACFITGAHFLRYGNMIGAIGFAIAPLLCFGPKAALRILQVGLLIALVFVWCTTTYDNVTMRLATDTPWLRLLAIMAGVIVLVGASAWSVEGLIRRKASRYQV